MESIITQIDLLKANIQFESVCEQIRLLNLRIDRLKIRYTRAERARNTRVLYALRLQLSTQEGVRNMFVEYATRKAGI